MAERRQAKREVGDLLPRLRIGLGGMGQPLTDEPREQFTTEEFDQAFGVVDDAVQRFGRMHRIEQPTLRQFRNTQRSAVYRIPLETLCFIFVYATGVGDKPHEEKDALGRSHIRRAMAISHVCSRWYNVAVSFPSLWTVLDADVPRRLTEMALERSCKLPLVLLALNGLYSQTNGTQESLKYLSQHIHRWQSARIAISEDRLGHVTQFPAPLLRYLQITPPVDYGASDISNVDQIISAQQFFQGQTPSLEKLDMAYWIQWDTPNLPSLRELRIGFWGIESPTVSGIVEMLAGCPRLEKLELDICLIAAEHPGPDTSTQAELPHLRQLTIIGSQPEHAAAILDHLQCPQLEHANIDFYRLFLDPEQISPMTSHLLQAIKPKFQNMLQGTNQIRLVLGKSGVGFRIERSPSLRPLSINLFKFDWRPVLEWALQEFPEISERCIAVLIYPSTKSQLTPATSSYGAVKDLIASLKSLEGVVASSGPEVCEIFRAFLCPGDSQSESSHHRIQGMLLDGCLCPWKEDIVRTLEETRSRQEKHLKRTEIIISANVDEDCEGCPATRDLLRPFVDDICFFSLSDL
ncbi:hypothetical protein M407DRAFT_24146 [Tulasnella calospora MUT 4182]|uniref:Uncharacterized protein n=1 Tax=Tulasnella calospora MUT 4182 TaxID=1051891 RepID=A0A0C3QJW4_9AGAM|nr:hypothetical protein M407DRAFT_24146 [Tulasnella calospora MUT 4182]